MVWGLARIFIQIVIYKSYLIPKHGRFFVIYLNDALLFCFSVSNFPTDFLSRTTNSTFLNKTMPLHKHSNKSKLKVYIYTCNGFLHSSFIIFFVCMILKCILFDNLNLFFTNPVD